MYVSGRLLPPSYRLRVRRSHRDLKDDIARLPSHQCHQWCIFFLQIAAQSTKLTPLRQKILNLIIKRGFSVDSHTGSRLYNNSQHCLR
jgi:hypothetical protein